MAKLTGEAGNHHAAGWAWHIYWFLSVVRA